MEDKPVQVHSRRPQKLKISHDPFRTLAWAKHPIAKTRLISAWQVLKLHLVAYCNITSLHGFRYLVDPVCGSLARLLWVCVIVLGAFATKEMIGEQLLLYQREPIVFSYQAKRTHIQDIPFPAVSICSQSQMLPSIFNYSALLLKPQDLLTVKEKHQLDYANYICSMEKIGSGFQRHLDTSVLDEIFQRRNKLCDEEFEEIQWQKVRLVPACDFLQPVLSRYGHCYTFNTASLFQYMRPQYSAVFVSAYSNLESTNITRNAEEELLWQRRHMMPWKTKDSSLYGGVIMTLNFRSHDFDDTCSLGDRSFSEYITPRVAQQTSLKLYTKFQVYGSYILEMSCRHTKRKGILPPAEKREILPTEFKLSWFRTVLTGREQRVRVGQTVSAPLPVKTGVPQGNAPRGAARPISFRIYRLDSDKKPVSFCCPLTTLLAKVVLIHSPTELPDASASEHVIQARMAGLIAVTPKITVSSQSVLKLPSSRRGCYLPHERRLQYFSSYSQRNCEIECLANWTMQQCGCSVPYHPREMDTPVCGMRMQPCVSLMGHLSDLSIGFDRRGQVSFTILMSHCNNSCGQHERNRWFEYLAHLLGRAPDGAMLPPVGLWLKVSKGESRLVGTDVHLES
ncbi:hypothetical protein J6590_020661 [Homalodisca vitripennis]|nr:hypothetical protein J6590_020661 [Homalodisca vitripennis]